MHADPIHAYPLTWPIGWARTPKSDLEDSKYRFKKRGNNLWTFCQARNSLLDELRRMGVDDWNIILSSNFPIDRSGLPTDRGARPGDQAVAVYFKLEGKQMVMACDLHVRAEENIRSLALSIEALRALERHGGGVMMELAFTGFTAIPAPQHPCWDMLGLQPGKHSAAAIDAAFRDRAKVLHPDAPGGSHQAFIDLQDARTDALRAIGAIP